MTAFEQVVESLTGESANPFFQLLGISLGIAALVFFLKRGQKKRESVWEADDLPEIIAPMEAPSVDMFNDGEDYANQQSSSPATLPLPEGGLPVGWTMEQWQHYGHQYQQQQDTVDKHNQM